MPPLDQLLEQSPLFASLNHRDRLELARTALSRHYTKGQVFACAGEVWPYLLLLVDGRVNAAKESSEGRSLIVVTLGPGEVFWGLAFFLDDAPMPVTLVAREECHTYLWDRRTLLPILLDNGRLSWELCRLMAGRMARASQVLDEMAFRPVTGRIARLLLDLFPGAEDLPVSRSLTLDEMAAHAGTTREVVCRLLYRFADDDLIRITRTELALRNKAGLAQLAERP